MKFQHERLQPLSFSLYPLSFDTVVYVFYLFSITLFSLILFDLLYSLLGEFTVPNLNYRAVALISGPGYKLPEFL